MKVGRNDPCPCGCGVKYKKCCAGQAPPEAEAAGPGGTNLQEPEDILQGEQFDTLSDASTFAADLIKKQNEAAVDDFHGLSPAQMHRFLYFPFDTPELVTFPSVLDVTPDGPVTICFRLLADAIGAEGVKLTAIGNLPRTFCRHAWEAFRWKEESESWASLGALSTERDFLEMHVTRLVSDVAGLIRKYKGKVMLTKACQKILTSHGDGGVYPRLFTACAWEYNWGCQDGYEPVPIIQQSFLFNLYLLSKYGGEWRESSFYAEAFLKAFPHALSEVKEDDSPEQRIRHIFELRFLKRFAWLMGLVELVPVGRSEGWRVRKLPLLEHVVQFHL